MNEKYYVQIKETAWEDIESIYHYIVKTFKSIDTAERHYEAFIQGISELAYDAEIRCGYVERKGILLYRKMVRNYMILYSVNEKLVTVLRVIYKKSDISSY